MTEINISTDSIISKAISKKDQAFAIFQSMLNDKLQGRYGSNKEFRSQVLSAFQSRMGVSIASASTMYNAVKKSSEADGAVVLGRDPKKVKSSAGNGKRGRPAGSKNRVKTVVPPHDVIVEEQIFDDVTA
jgi:hypothetical protein